MKIICVCSKALNRSIYLAKYLRSKGYNADYFGINKSSKKPLNQEGINESKIIITLRKPIFNKLKKRFNIKNKKIIQLNIVDNPYRLGKETIKLYKKSPKDFKKKMRLNIRKQIKAYFPLKNG